MTMFYELKKMGKLEALRTAQLDVLKGNWAECGEGLPSTWGAFARRRAGDKAELEKGIAQAASA